MDRSLGSLDSKVYWQVVEMLAKFTEAEIQVMIVQTTRTQAEHAANLANGSSWIEHSLHLDGLAIDVAPFDVYQLHGPDKLKWDGGDPVWERMGKIGESVGLIWGGRWTKRDLGHFEYHKVSPAIPRVV